MLFPKIKKAKGWTGLGWRSGIVFERIKLVKPTGQIFKNKWDEVF